MNEINKEEMFGNLRNFLKSKGIELQDEGAYSQHIRRGCDILTDTVNLSQRGFENAKSAMERRLDQLRQTIHEHTAPKAQSAPIQPAPPQSATPNETGAKKQSGKAAARAGKASPKKSRRKSKK